MKENQRKTNWNSFYKTGNINDYLKYKSVNIASGVSLSQNEEETYANIGGGADYPGTERRRGR